jgi:Fingers domain of DNA polymerase lambda
MRIWYRSNVGGIFTLEDLRALDKSELTPNQRVGLKYFEELDSMIPREEMQVWEVTTLSISI